jgi:hypothetical protein
LGLPAVAVRGGSRRWLEERLASSRPVLVWVTGDYRPRAAVEGTDRAGRRFRAVAWEHAALATGSAADGVRLWDPSDGRQRSVPWGSFLDAWRSLDGMAVWVPSEPSREWQDRDARSAR